MRRSTILVVLMASVVGFGLFQLKYEVMKLESQHKKIQRAIKDSEEAISILNAEWSHLTSPERLQKLASKYLDVIPVSGRQLVSWRQVVRDFAPEDSVEDTVVEQNRFGLDQLVSTVLNDDSLGLAEGD